LGMKKRAGAASHGKVCNALAVNLTDQRNADTEISFYSPVITALGADNAPPYPLAWWGRFK
jgi:uncharacterized metal-binding protein